MTIATVMEISVIRPAWLLSMSLGGVVIPIRQGTCVTQFFLGAAYFPLIFRPEVGDGGSGTCSNGKPSGKAEQPVGSQDQKNQTRGSGHCQNGPRPHAYQECGPGSAPTMSFKGQ